MENGMWSDFQTEFRLQLKSHLSIHALNVSVALDILRWTETLAVLPLGRSVTSIIRIVVALTGFNHRNNRAASRRQIAVARRRM